MSTVEPMGLVDLGRSGLPQGSSDRPPGPIHLSLAPSMGRLTGADRVTITSDRGGLTGTTAVRFGANLGTALAVVDDTTVQVTTPNGGVVGYCDVTVTTPAGQLVSRNAYEYGQVPTITSCNPSSGGGSLGVGINGSRFQTPGAPLTRVTFAGVDATNVGSSSDTVAVCLSPTGPGPGAVAVAVFNRFGSASLAGGYTYT